MLAGVIAGQFEQLVATLLFSKQSKSETVRRMQLLGKEITTSRHNVSQLKQTCCCQKCFNIVLAQLNGSRITILDQHLQWIPMHIYQSDLLLLGFSQRPCKHCRKIRRRRWQNDSMSRNSEMKGRGKKHQTESKHRNSSGWIEEMRTRRYNDGPSRASRRHKEMPAIDVTREQCPVINSTKCFVRWRRISDVERNCAEFPLTHMAGTDKTHHATVRQTPLDDVSVQTKRI